MVEEQRVFPATIVVIPDAPSHFIPEVLVSTPVPDKVKIDIRSRIAEQVGNLNETLSRGTIYRFGEWYLLTEKQITRRERKRGRLQMKGYELEAGKPRHSKLPPFSFH